MNQAFEAARATEITTAKQESKQAPLGRITAAFVYIFEKIMPDPFVFAVLLTFFGALLAWEFAPHATPASITSA